MFGIQGKEMLFLLIIVLVIFGPSKLPQLARAIGKSMRELKDGLSGEAGPDSKPRQTENNEWEHKTTAQATDAQPVQRSEEKTV